MEGCNGKVQRPLIEKKPNIANKKQTKPPNKKHLKNNKTKDQQI
jgi:hypothetical protein